MADEESFGEAVAVGRQGEEEAAGATDIGLPTDLSRGWTPDRRTIGSSRVGGGVSPGAGQGLDRAALGGGGSAGADSPTADNLMANTSVGDGRDELVEGDASASFVRHVQEAVRDQSDGDQDDGGGGGGDEVVGAATPPELQEARDAALATVPVQFIGPLRRLALAIRRGLAGDRFGPSELVGRDNVFAAGRLGNSPERAG